jgi:hypothetical protein
MSLKEIFRNRKEIYDPVHAHVPGVNEEYVRELREKFFNDGDPMPKPEPPKEEIIFKLPGIRIVRITRSS